MTEAAVPPSAYARPPGSQASADGQRTADVAKDQASAIKQSAADAGQHAAGVAKEQTQNVIAEAGNRTKDLLEQARGELGSQASAQQQRVAAGLRALGDELHAMTQHESDPGVATDLARQGATRSHDLASWLEGREPGSLLEELKGFARLRPSAFLGIAAGAGLLAGRLTRGVKDASGNPEPPPATTATSTSSDFPAGGEAAVAVAPAPFFPTPGPDGSSSEDRGLGLGAGI